LSSAPQSAGSDEEGEHEGESQAKHKERYEVERERMDTPQSLPFQGLALLARGVIGHTGNLFTDFHG
jgi:hypothetical protein